MKIYIAIASTDKAFDKAQAKVDRLSDRLDTLIEDLNYAKDILKVLKSEGFGTKKANDAVKKKLSPYAAKHWAASVKSEEELVKKIAAKKASVDKAEAKYEEAKAELAKLRKAKNIKPLSKMLPAKKTVQESIKFYEKSIEKELETIEELSQRREKLALRIKDAKAVLSVRKKLGSSRMPSDVASKLRAKLDESSGVRASMKVESLEEILRTGPSISKHINKELRMARSRITEDKNAIKKLKAKAK